jgi:hypothetical protein
MDNRLDESYYYVRGLLSAFESLNHKTNHVCSYTLDAIERTATLEEDLARFFDGALASVSLDRIDSWPDHVIALAERWLFAFVNPREAIHLADATASFSISDRSSQLILADELIQMLRTAVEPCVPWCANIVTNGFYECE